MIYEFPVESPPYGLNVAGVDPYRQGKSAYSSSLGAVYVYKRMHDITGEKYQDMFVASYVGRPDKKETWEEQARLLIKYYNARTLCENDDISFIEYMKSKGDAHYLEKQPQWLMEVVPNTTVKREYGVHRSSDKVIDYLHNCLKKYMEEVIYKETDENGNVTKEVTLDHVCCYRLPLFSLNPDLSLWSFRRLIDALHNRMGSNAGDLLETVHCWSRRSQR